LTLLQALPKLRAVGVELDPDLADEARRRAAELGVADRVEIITGDATTFISDPHFDFGIWSQWFFPTATRPGALATLFAYVRRGGAVRAPVFGLHDQIARDPTGKQARSYAVDRIMLDAWGAGSTGQRNDLGGSARISLVYEGDVDERPSDDGAAAVGSTAQREGPVAAGDRPAGRLLP
jgi:hypothetical protein